MYGGEQKDYSLKNLGSSLPFGSSVGKIQHKSIYRKDTDVFPDHQDNVKVNQIKNKFCKPRIRGGVDIGK
jgi:hypothetical protein